MATSNTSRAISIGIIVSVIIIIIIYVIVMYELFINKEFIFAPFTPPTPSTPHFYPLGTVTPLNQEQINHRNAVILASTGVAP
jgi:hypothetical protein